MERVVTVIGDLHGCIDEFNELLNLISYNKRLTRLVLCGDIMDRGPGQIELLRKAQEMGIESVLGNHESKHYRWFINEQKRKLHGKPNTMKPMHDSEQLINAQLTEDDIKWMKQLPLTIDLGDNWHIVHAGVAPNKSLKNQDPGDLTHIRFVDANGKAISLNKDHSQPKGSVYWTKLWKGPENLIFGHAVRSMTEPVFELISDGLKPFVKCLSVDTGCVFGGRLTAAILDPQKTTPTYVQVQAKKTYYGDYWGTEY